jgi:uncharacterized protein (UPF0128 family)
MINNEEKFFSYLKGRMNSEERKTFEDELIHSENFHKEFIEYKKLNSIIEETKNIALSQDYAASIITIFRKRKELKEIKKSYPKFRYAFASILIIIGGYFLISELNKENPKEIKSLLTEFSDAELNSFSDDTYYSSNIDKNIDEDAISRIDSIYTENISASVFESMNESSMDYIFSINNLVDVDEYISDSDIDLIYKELINKEIL